MYFGPTHTHSLRWQLLACTVLVPLILNLYFLVECWASDKGSQARIRAPSRCAASKTCNSLDDLVECNDKLPKKETSVAHCIVGGVRTLYQADVYARMRENLIEAIGGEGSEIFIYTDLRSESSAKGSFATMQLEQLQPAFRYLEGREGNVSNELLLKVREHHLSTLLDNSQVLKNGTITLADPMPAIAYPIWVHQMPSELSRDIGVRCGALCTGQFDKWHRCFQKVAEREKERGFRFDWIVKSRPDLIWHFPTPPIQRVNAAKRQLYWIFDRVMYIPRESLALVADVSRVSCKLPAMECGMGQKLGRSKSCWCLLKASLLKHSFCPGSDKRRRWKHLFKLNRTESEAWRLYTDSFKRTDEAKLMLDAFGLQGLHGQTFARAKGLLSKRMATDNRYNESKYALEVIYNQSTD
jgi:hypothetical protein